MRPSRLRPQLSGIFVAALWAPLLSAQEAPPVLEVKRDEPAPPPEDTPAAAPTDATTAPAEQGSKKEEAAKTTVLFSGKPPEQKPLPVRFAFGFGGQYTNADAALTSFANPHALGAHIFGAVGPAGWPVMLGLQAGAESYGGPTLTYAYNGAVRENQLNFHSYSVLLFVRVQPDSWYVRPRLDLLAGMWGLDVGVSKPTLLHLESDSSNSLGGRVTGAVGIGAGVDVVGRTFGLGFGVQWLSGGGMTMPDVNTARVENDRLVIDQRTTRAIGQLMFLLDVVLVSPPPETKK